MICFQVSENAGKQIESDLRKLDSKGNIAFYLSLLEATRSDTSCRCGRADDRPCTRWEVVASRDSSRETSREIQALTDTPRAHINAGRNRLHRQAFGQRVPGTHGGLKGSRAFGAEPCYAPRLPGVKLPQLKQGSRVERSVRRLRPRQSATPRRSGSAAQCWSGRWRVYRNGIPVQQLPQAPLSNFISLRCTCDFMAPF
jgi:hypothetical protein